MAARGRCRPRHLPCSRSQPALLPSSAPFQAPPQRPLGHRDDRRVEVVLQPRQRRAPVAAAQRARALGRRREAEDPRAARGRLGGVEVVLLLRCWAVACCSRVCCCCVLLVGEDRRAFAVCARATQISLFAPFPMHPKPSQTGKPLHHHHPDPPTMICLTMICAYGLLPWQWCASSNTSSPMSAIWRQPSPIATTASFVGMKEGRGRRGVGSRQEAVCSEPLLRPPCPSSRLCALCSFPAQPTNMHAHLALSERTRTDACASACSSTSGVITRHSGDGCCCWLAADVGADAAPTPAPAPPPAASSSAAPTGGANAQRARARRARPPPPPPPPPPPRSARAGTPCFRASAAHCCATSALVGARNTARRRAAASAGAMRRTTSAAMSVLPLPVSRTAMTLPRSARRMSSSW